MMKDRCLNPAGQDYRYYGARGIKIDPNWLTYDGFVSDMGVRPDGLTLDREDSDGDYSVSNCRWATREEQSRNRSYTLNLSYGGRTQKVWEWAKELGVKQTTIHIRLWKLRRGEISEAQVFSHNPRK